MTRDRSGHPESILLDTKGTKAEKSTMNTKDTKESPHRTLLKPNAASYRVIGCALRVHTAKAPGSLERAIAECMHHEMKKSGLFVEDEVTIPLIYEDVRLPVGYRADFVVEKCLIVEIKCVKEVLPVHKAQVLNYLRQADLKLGLLLNFNVAHMRNGIHRVINGPESEL